LLWSNNKKLNNYLDPTFWKLGALSQSAQEFIQTVVWSARDYTSPWSPEEIKRHLVSVIAIAIQRGNGLAVAAAWDRELKELWCVQAA